MLKLKQLRKKVKKTIRWKHYKQKFAHRSLRLILSRTALIFGVEISFEELVKLELAIFKTDKGPMMFVENFQKLKFANGQSNILWDEFGWFVWYIYQTSTFWKDTKAQVNNVFTSSNYVQVNEQKRKHYYAWLHSLPLSMKAYNQRIKAVLTQLY